MPADSGLRELQIVDAPTVEPDAMTPSGLQVASDSCSRHASATPYAHFQKFHCPIAFRLILLRRFPGVRNCRHYPNEKRFMQRYLRKPSEICMARLG